MCTLIVFKNIDPNFPLVIASNRDEQATRPTQMPSPLQHGIFAPLDLVHGGSWIGVNDRGSMVALTNRFLAPRYHGRRSRGLIVTDALMAPTARDAVNRLKNGPAGIYNGFQLYLDDGHDSILAWSDGEDVRETHLFTRGIWVFTGDDDLPGNSERHDHVTRFVGDDPRLNSLDWLRDLLSFHGTNSENGTCVHGPKVQKETVFSMIIRRPFGRNAWEISWRSGRPCRSKKWNDVTVPWLGHRAEKDSR